jgi:hypothetical protein
LTQLTLFHTAACHLCEEAHGLISGYLSEQGKAENTQLTLADIADDPALLERYGTLIPVLRDDASGRQLNWPFDQTDLAQWL